MQFGLHPERARAKAPSFPRVCISHGQAAVDLSMAPVPSVALLTARADALRHTAEALRSAFRQPAMQALVADAAINLREAQRWLGDTRLDGSDDCRLWVDCVLSVTARRLKAFEEALRTHGPDATGSSA